MPIDPALHRAKLSEFDRRIASGPKVVATGEDVLATTPEAADAKGWLFRVTCSCGYRGPLSNHQLAHRGLGDTPMRGLLPKMRCRQCGAAAKSVEMIDPYRDGLDPD